MTDVDLRRVAVVYLTAVHDYRPPTRAVEAEYGVGRGEAGRYISRARAERLLPSASKGRFTPDEGHWPRMAKLLNGRRRWVVCQTCHHPWPCPDPDTLHWIDRISGDL